MNPIFFRAGRSRAGKTTALYKLKLGEVVTTIPTIGEWQQLHTLLILSPRLLFCNKDVVGSLAVSYYLIYTLPIIIFDHLIILHKLTASDPKLETGKA